MDKKIALVIVPQEKKVDIKNEKKIKNLNDYKGNFLNYLKNYSTDEKQVLTAKFYQEKKIKEIIDDKGEVQFEVDIKPEFEKSYFSKFRGKWFTQVFLLMKTFLKLYKDTELNHELENLVAKYVAHDKEYSQIKKEFFQIAYDKENLFKDQKQVWQKLCALPKFDEYLNQRKKLISKVDKLLKKVIKRINLFIENKKVV